MCEKHVQYYKRFEEENSAAIAMAEHPKDPELIMDYLFKRQSADLLEDVILIERILQARPERINEDLVRPDGSTIWLFGRWVSSLHLAAKRYPDEQKRFSEKVEFAYSRLPEILPPKKQIAVVNLAQAAFAYAKFDKSVKLYEKIEKWQPDYSFEYGAALFECGLAEKALAEFSRLGFSKLTSPRPRLEYLIKVLESTGRQQEADEFRLKDEERRREVTAGSQQVPPLPKEFLDKFNQLYDLEKEIISLRFGLRMEPRRFHSEPMTYRNLAAHYFGKDEVFVQHIEEIAIAKLGFDTKYLMSLRHPGYEHDESAPLDRVLELSDVFRNKYWKEEH